MAKKRPDPRAPDKARTSGQSSDPIDVAAPRAETGKTRDLARDTAQPSEALTTNQGLRLSSDQDSLKAGLRGPTLLEDFHLREKITHFDHERIPERVVHARGYGVHGVFRAYEDLSDLTMAPVLNDPTRETPVFVRFSTVVGSRGSPDCPRDVRGFAVKFYTDEGVWDLVGNNMPVFFIQDAVKFPDLIHAVKPEQHNEIPQAQSAHDTFWDFVSLTPESAHMLMWLMSDRAIPRSYAMMEGFGVHTFRLVNAAGRATFVKFHWKPLKGVRSLVWDEAQKLNGKDPDFNRRDLFESIERGDFPEYELGIQAVPEEDEHRYDFDLLDPTKIIPEELVPVRRIGCLTLNRNPDNFFAETEQVAFHVGHVVPGIDFTNDPLLQGRLFSYLDTQLRRVGPNFHELPVNRSRAPVANHQREGFARHTIDPGRVSYFPSRLGGGAPAPVADGFRPHDERVDRTAGARVRQRSASFADHFSQATMFWNSMSDWEQQHIADAFSFELNQVESAEVRHHVMNELLVNIHEVLAASVSLQTGIPIAPVGDRQRPTPSAPSPSGPLRDEAATMVSAALSMDVVGDTIRGRRIAILGGRGVDALHLAQAKAILAAEGAVVELIASHAGTIEDGNGNPHLVSRAAPNAPSVLYDAVLVAGGESARALAATGTAIHFVNEAYRHGKPIAAVAEGQLLIEASAVMPGDGVVFGVDPDPVARDLIEALKRHRFPRRAVALVPA